MIRALAIIILLGIVAVFTGGALFYQYVQQPLPLPEQGIRFTVKPGENLSAVAARLEREGVIEYADILKLLARYWQLDAQLRPGEYQLMPPQTYQSLLKRLSSGAVVTYRVTLPEGLDLAQSIARLQQQEVLQHSLSGVDDPWFKTLEGPAAEHPEGWFFPDTYQYTRGDSDKDILRRAYQKMQDVLALQWNKRAPALPYKTPYEALIMASIIERETGVGHERGEIAGVFVRRLKRGMRLQTDPTVMYGIAGFDGNLRRSHLKDGGNPYNTYHHHGLPPTPIALPGEAAIYAALHPKEGETLYFVARGDGSHQFSKTLREHRAAVRRYQLKRRADYRSSPATGKQ
ncbi:MAG: hypothetical protein CSA53_07750 [Gammaproteobacteria bacterium]|nr:MAG: hypothetical protein CSA53_07750 [Gammaproteobacteria bacterium]